MQKSLIIKGVYMNVNKIILLGNVVKKPTIGNTNDGRAVANFTLATNETWKDKNTGEKKERAEYHRISCFNEGLVNIISNYVDKGSKLYIEGQLQTRKWQDESGSDRYSTEIVLQGYNCSLVLLDKKSSDNVQEAPLEGNHLNDDVPF